MASRHRAPHVLRLHDQAPPILARAPPRPQHYPAALDEPLDLRRLPPNSHTHQSILVAEDRLDGQHREIQALLIDNQRLAATHVALKQELEASQYEVRRAASAAAETRAVREAEIRKLFERSVSLEADARAAEGMRAELEQVRSDVQQMAAAKDEMVEKLQGLKAELARARAEMAQSGNIKAEIEAMHHEIQRGRAAVLYERKACASNLEQSEAMKKNMISMAHEVEKLRSELANADKRARAAAAANPGAAAAYAASYASSDTSYGGNNYQGAYSMHQVQIGADGAHYGSGAVS